MPEQCSFDQGGGDGRAVECKKGFVAPGAGGVELLGDAFLAGAGLAFDQDRKRRVGKLLDSVEHRVHGRAVADQAFVGGACAGRAARLQRVMQDLAQIGRVGRFGDEFERAQGAGMAGVAVVALAREHDDLHLRGVCEQVANEGEAFVGAMRDRWQAEVDQCQRRRHR